MKTYFINGFKVSEDEIILRFYGIFEANENDIKNWVDLNGVKGMAKAVRWFMRGNGCDFYEMIQNIFVLK